MARFSTWREFAGPLHHATREPMLMRAANAPKDEHPKRDTSEQVKGRYTFKEDVGKFEMWGDYKSAYDLYMQWQQIQIGTSFPQWLKDCAWVHRKQAWPPKPKEGK